MLPSLSWGALQTMTPTAWGKESLLCVAERVCHAHFQSCSMIYHRYTCAFSWEWSFKYRKFSVVTLPPWDMTSCSNELEHTYKMGWKSNHSFDITVLPYLCFHFIYWNGCILETWASVAWSCFAFRWDVYYRTVSQGFPVHTLCFRLWAPGEWRIERKTCDIISEPQKGRFFPYRSCFPLSKVNGYIPCRGLEKVHVALSYLAFSPVESGLMYIKINACYAHLQILVSWIHLYTFQIVTHRLCLILMICMCLCVVVVGAGVTRPVLK